MNEQRFDAFERFVWRCAVAAVSFLMSAWVVGRCALFVWRSFVG